MAEPRSSSTRYLRPLLPPFAIFQSQVSSKLSKVSVEMMSPLRLSVALLAGSVSVPSSMVQRVALASGFLYPRQPFRDLPSNSEIDGSGVALGAWADVV